MLDKFPQLCYNKGTKNRRYPTMMDWEIMEHYEELVEVIHEWLENA